MMTINTMLFTMEHTYVCKGVVPAYERPGKHRSLPQADPEGLADESVFDEAPTATSPLATS